MCKLRAIYLTPRAAAFFYEAKPADVGCFDNVWSQDMGFAVALRVGS